ncbi:MAG: alpha/beta hydrolase [Ferruginibacter sp.]|nr:alpha/beta hydrolase [Ferruginibacter sp.]
MQSQFIKTNGIKLHYLNYEGGKPTIILMHGLTANAHTFDGLIAAGLSPAFNLVSVDLRGRGLSDQPVTGYTMAEHAKDIVGLLAHLQIEKAVIGGHSYGALLTYYLAVHYPQRIDKMILLDAAARMHENTKEMLIPAMSRIGQTFSSFNAYLEKVKTAPYLTAWDDAMLSYYQADIIENNDGTVTQRSQPRHITEAVTKVLAEPWPEYIKGVAQEAILINGTGAYTLNAPLLPKEYAMETVNIMKRCTYAEVSGNHQTMLYGTGAKQITKAIKSFLK